jgi:hypothetical protein
MTPFFRWTIAVIVLCVIAAASVANAGTAQLTCTPPTHNTDDTLITGTISYRFVWGTSATSLTNTVESSSCSATVTVPDPAPGASVTYHFAVKAIVGGQESDLSNVATKTFSTPAPIPNPPTTLKVVEQTVYKINQNWNRMALEQVGTIPVGTTCDPKQYAVGLHLVKRELVQVMPGKSRPNVALAKCG